MVHLINKLVALRVCLDLDIFLPAVMVKHVSTIAKFKILHLAFNAVVCQENCEIGTYDPHTGCNNCTLGYVSPACCECDTGYVRLPNDQCFGKCKIENF